MTLRQTLRITGYTIALVMLFELLRHTVPFSVRLDYAGRDFATRLRAQFSKPPKEIDRLIVVTLDDETVRVVDEKYPYPRWLHAHAIDGFMAQHPAAVAYDFVFGGHGTVEEDEIFQRALGRSQGLVLASYIGSDRREQAPDEKFLPPGVMKGMINKFSDPGGLARRGVPFLVNQETKEREWNWELAALFQAGITSPERVGFHSNVFNPLRKESADFSLPVSREGLYDINFLVRPEEFRKVPFWKFMPGAEPPVDLEGKIFLVGHTAKLSHDIHPSPFGSIYGVFLNANVLLMMLSGRFLYTMPGWAPWLLLAIVFWGMIDAAFAGRTIRMSIWAGSAIVVFLLLSVLMLWLDVLLDLYWEAFYVACVWFILIIYRQMAMALENIALREEAIHDPLTGFFTRRFLSVRLKHDLAKLGISARAGKRTGQPGQFSFAMVDLDNFKLVNDTFGHDEGDRTLRNVAEIIRNLVRRDDVVCRYGGDEFCIIMRGTSGEGAKVLLERVREGILADDRLCYKTRNNVPSIRVTASFGVVSAEWSPDLTEESIIKMADQALYHAKKAGRNQIAVADPNAPPPSATQAKV